MRKRRPQNTDEVSNGSNRQNRKARSGRQVREGYGEILAFTKPTFTPKTSGQRKAHATILANTATFLTGPAGTGKAQPLTAMVRTPKGWDRMGDVKVGSTVITPDGTESLVTGVYPQGLKDIYRITFEDGRSTECCDEHLWNVYLYDWQPSDTRWRTLPLRDIRINLEVNKSWKNRLYVQLPEPEIKEDIDLPIDPYVLGIILGDGHITKNSVVISTQDQFIVDEVSKLIGDDFELVNRTRPIDYGIVKKVRRNGKINTSSFIESLRYLELDEARSHIKFIPDEYMEASPSQKLSLLQGLMDSDGTSDVKTGSVSFCTTSSYMASQVQDLVRSLGGICRISIRTPHYTYKEEYKSGKMAYNLNIRYKDPSSLFRLPRKKQRCPDNYQYTDCLRLRIKYIEYVGKKEAQCIMIDHPDHLYITDEYIVTHNTHVAIAVGIPFLLSNNKHKLILTNPGIEIGQKLGILPGDKDDKIAVAVRPMRDILVKLLGAAYVESLVKLERVIFEPLGSILGCTYDDSVVLLDEAQNSTPSQMKALLTRVGHNTKIVLAGDYKEQKFIDGMSGLEDSLNRLKHLHNVGHVDFTMDDIVRGDFCKSVIGAYREENDVL